VQRDELVAYLDEYLNVAGIPDISNNGLQVQGSEDVQSVAFAVDVCVEAITQANAQGAGMLVVHHGLFWGQPRMLVGPHYQRVRALLDAGISLYASHIPLDVHPEVGNNVQLALALGFEIDGTHGEHHGTPLGVAARLPAPRSREQVIAHIEKTLGVSATTWPFGNDIIRRVAIVSGSAANMIDGVVAEGFDLYLTGETNHIYYHEAREYRLNVVYGGHYATETWGLKALGRRVQQECGLDTVFIDLPTGL
jgi:dinuclear metal center YbgI/SA1388 family protein